MHADRQTDRQCKRVCMHACMHCVACHHTMSICGYKRVSLTLPRVLCAALLAVQPEPWQPRVLAHPGACPTACLAPHTITACHVVFHASSMVLAKA